MARRGRRSPRRGRAAARRRDRARWRDAGAARPGAVPGGRRRHV